MKQITEAYYEVYRTLINQFDSSDIIARFSNRTSAELLSSHLNVMKQYDDYRVRPVNTTINIFDSFDEWLKSGQTLVKHTGKTVDMVLEKLSVHEIAVLKAAGLLEGWSNEDGDGLDENK